MRGSILIKSGEVARIGVAEIVFFSEVIALVETAMGAMAEMFSSSEIAVASAVERLDCWKVLAEVSSSITLVRESLVDLGRTTMRSGPISEISDLTKLEILPMSERINMILATPIAMPRQVRKERVRFSLIEVLASL